MPFAEYMPLRTIGWPCQRARSTWCAGLRRRAPRRACCSSARSTLGDVICFEVAYDGIVRDTVTGGAQLLVVQTNNATFDEAEARQQLAMVAAAGGRARPDGVMASTVGVSAYRRHRRRGRPDATASSTLRGVIVRDGAAADRGTLATRSARWPEMALPWRWSLALAGRGARCAAAWRREQRRARPGGAVSDVDGYAGTLGRVLVVIPTYNEAENLPLIVDRVRGRVPEVDMLVADDNSPDGTGEIADELAAADDHVHVLHRAGKQGLGAAYLAGFALGPRQGYDVVVEMDADGSHPPEELPQLLDGARRRRPGARLALGARRQGGQLAAAPAAALPRRQHLHAAGAGHAGPATPPAATAAYRVRGAARRSTLDDVASQGYCFQVDLAWRTAAHGLPGRRGADHVRRAGARGQQDEQRHHGRVVVAHRGLGPVRPARAAARQAPLRTCDRPQAAPERFGHARRCPYVRRSHAVLQTSRKNAEWGRRCGSCFSWPS